MRAMMLGLLISYTSAICAADNSSPLCEGTGCDAYLPLLKKQVQFEDRRPAKGWAAALGGASGAIIGEEVAGAPGAVGFGALGAFLGYKAKRDWRAEERAREYDAAWHRGDDLYYNPAHPIPLKPQYLGRGR